MERAVWTVAGLTPHQGWYRGVNFISNPYFSISQAQKVNGEHLLAR